MQFTVTERIKAEVEPKQLVEELLDQFKNKALVIEPIKRGIKVESVNATFGSINRKDSTEITIKKKDKGYLLVADCTALSIILCKCLLAPFF